MPEVISTCYLYHKEPKIVFSAQFFPLHPVAFSYIHIQVFFLVHVIYYPDGE